MAKAQRKHIYKYVKPDDVKLLLVSGVIGGINIRGNLDMNFYVESNELQKTGSHNVSDDGKISGEQDPIPNKLETSSIRQIQTAVSLDRETAKSIIQWMTRHINNYESALEQVNTEKNALNKKN